MLPLSEPLVLADFTIVRPAKPCKIADILAKLGDEERALAETALAGTIKTYPHTQIAAALSRRVSPVSDNAVREHRIGRCSCQIR